MFFFAKVHNYFYFCANSNRDIMIALRKTKGSEVRRLPVVCLFLLAAFVRSFAQNSSASGVTLSPVPLKDVLFEDFFWRPRMRCSQREMLPVLLEHSAEKWRYHHAGSVVGQEGCLAGDNTDIFKAIEAASYVLTVKYDEQLDARVDSLVGLVAGTLETIDGAEGPSVLWGNGKTEGCGHLYEAAVAHYRATGKRSLLDAACKHADGLCEAFGAGTGRIRSCGEPSVVIGALCELYQATGVQKYLELAGCLVEQTGRDGGVPGLASYALQYTPILQRDKMSGPATLTGNLYAGVTEWARLTGNRDYIDASVRVWNDLVNTKLYLTGGMGSLSGSEAFGAPYDLPSHTARCGTCAAIALIRWSHQLFLATGQSRYIDVMERALYNAMLAGVSEMGDCFSVTNPLASDGNYSRRHWSELSCCPANFTRMLADLPSLAYAAHGRDVYVNLYVAGAATIRTDEMTLAVRQRNSMPNAAAAALVLFPEKDVECTIHLRIPSWTTDTLIDGSTLYNICPVRKRRLRVMVNGVPAHPEKKDGYFVFRRVWKTGDVIKIEWPTLIRRITANPAVKDAAGKMAVQRGPLVYCFEAVDQPDSLLTGRSLIPDNPIGVTFRKGLPVGYMYLYGEMRKHSPKGDEEVHFRMIPYYAWNNRGFSAMQLWMPALTDTVADERKETTK